MQEQEILEMTADILSVFWEDDEEGARELFEALTDEEKHWFNECARSLIYVRADKEKLNLFLNSLS